MITGGCHKKDGEPIYGPRTLAAPRLRFLSFFFGLGRGDGDLGQFGGGWPNGPGHHKIKLIKPG